MEKPVCRSLCQIMLKEHEKINALLNDFEKNASNQTFNRFKSELEKHFFVEEKIIFNVYSIEDSNDSHLNLIKQHRDILWLIKQVEENIGKKDLILELKNLLKSHSDFENNIFYPKLDNSLDKDQKLIIASKIEENLKD